GICGAANNIWNNDSGNFVWDSVSSNWQGPATWDNAASDIAIFRAGGAGAITVGAPVSARAISFQANGYTLSGPANRPITLTSGGVGLIGPAEIGVIASEAKIASPLAGTFGLKKSGGGKLILTAASSYVGDTQISGGTLQLGDGASSGSLLGDIDVGSAGTLAFANPGVTVFSGAIAGAGSLLAAGPDDSALALTGNVGLGMGVQIARGTLSVGGGGTTGNLAGNVVNQSTLEFHRTSAMSYDDVISGDGTVRKLGSALLNLTGENSYTGDTEILDGTLQLFGSGSFASSRNVVVHNTATLVAESLSGGLNHDGESFALAPAQSLTGGGLIRGNVAVREQATLAPGEPVGSMVVDGDVKFEPGSTLAVHLNGATDSDAERSRLVVSGSLAFGGTALPINPFTVHVINTGGFDGTVATSFLVASADSIVSQGLDTPIDLTVGADGSGAAGLQVRLSVTDFDPGAHFSLQRSGSHLALSFVPAPTLLQADFDGDGDVDAFDLAIWENAYGTNSQGDADSDGDSDGQDFMAWQRQFGAPAQTPASVSVPEPSAALLAASLALCIKGRRIER
ncbi:MAG: autotransporter-associated beta strand repeat-containing protein, partial [Planctomycetales bacterium]|nr:autotransporter-associated beta strand repeat-containing protein [Planctomycetales bacterium]